MTLGLEGQLLEQSRCRPIIAGLSSCQAEEDKADSQLLLARKKISKHDSKPKVIKNILQQKHAITRTTRTTLTRSLARTLPISLLHNKHKIISTSECRRRPRRQANHKTMALGQLSICLLLAISSIIITHEPVSASMSLPDGIENILGFVPRSSFQCERDGYFGDTENDCRLFHLCQRTVNSNGRTEWRHWTYACGNQTMFNQLTLTCAFVDEAIPCKHASQFQYLNEVIHRPREPFLTDADVTSGFSYYSNRIMSDGARARAFEDSTLMAQLGGGGSSVAAAPAASASFASQVQPVAEFTMPDNFNNVDLSSSVDTRQPRTRSVAGDQDQLILNPTFSSISNNHQQHHQQQSVNLFSNNNNNNNQFVQHFNHQQNNAMFNVDNDRDSMAPVASNQPKQFTANVEEQNSNNNQQQFSSNRQADQQQDQFQFNFVNNFNSQHQQQAQNQVAPETFNYAIATSHQFGAQAPIVPVITKPGTQLQYTYQAAAFGNSDNPIAPPPPPQPITTSTSTQSPSFGLQSTAEARAFDQIDNQNQQVPQTTQVNNDRSEPSPTTTTTTTTTTTGRDQGEQAITTTSSTTVAQTAGTSVAPTTGSDTPNGSTITTPPATVQTTPQTTTTTIATTTTTQQQPQTTTSSIVLSTEMPISTQRSTTTSNNQELQSGARRERFASGRFTTVHNHKNTRQRNNHGANSGQHHNNQKQANTQSRQARLHNAASGHGAFVSFESARLTKRHNMPTSSESPIVLRSHLTTTRNNETTTTTTTNNNINSSTTTTIATPVQTTTTNTQNETTTTNSRQMTFGPKMVVSPRFESMILGNRRRP